MKKRMVFWVFFLAFAILPLLIGCSAKDNARNAALAEKGKAKYVFLRK